MKRDVNDYFTTGNLLPIVEKILSKRNSFLTLAEKHKKYRLLYITKKVENQL